MGIHSRHFAEPRSLSFPHQMGGPQYGTIPLRTIWHGGCDVGEEKRKSKNELWKIESSNEVRKILVCFVIKTHLILTFWELTYSKVEGTGWN